MRILVADDERSIRFVLREALEELGHEVLEADSGEAALRVLEESAAHPLDLAVVDIRMPGASGLELLDRIRERWRDTPVVIITAENTFDNAVEAMKRGALDYLVKPFRVAEIQALAEKAARARALEAELRTLRAGAARSAPAAGPMVGRSAAILEVFKTVGRLAASSVPVLITGESGTGKELVARAIHAAGPRAAAPFVAVNAAAIPRELLESELFGHERGAFTGAVEARPGRFREASGGTLFLDEIGDMPLDLQAKILRVLQSGEIAPVGGRTTVAPDVRVLAATHRDLDAEVAAGRFREDLLYRLRVVPLHIPPLRERPEDIEVLARHFVDRYAGELGSCARHLAPATLERLEAHPWPGNVRELENAIKRALVLATGEVLAPEDFAFLGGAGAGAGGADDFEAALAAEAERALGERPGEALRELVTRVERRVIDAALARTRGNQLRAAALLGINRNTLRKKISELGLAPPGPE